VSYVDANNKKNNRKHVVKLGLAMKKGKHLGTGKGVVSISVREFKITPKEYRSPYNIDGDPHDVSPIHVTCLKRALKLFYLLENDQSGAAPPTPPPSPKSRKASNKSPGGAKSRSVTPSSTLSTSPSMASSTASSPTASPLERVEEASARASPTPQGSNAESAQPASPPPEYQRNAPPLPQTLKISTEGGTTVGSTTEPPVTTITTTAEAVPTENDKKLMEGLRKLEEEVKQVTTM
jgi:hypothetical protein